MNLFEPFFDPEDLSACVSAETKVRQLNALARAHGIYFPLWIDPEQTFGELYLRHRVCSRSFRFGLIGDNVLGLRFRLKNGRCVDLGGRVVKNVTGFDLTRFFSGSQGVFGTPETLVLRLRPLAPFQKTMILSGPFQALETFRAALMASAWVHAVDSFDFEVKNGMTRLALGWSCDSQDSQVFEKAFRQLAEDCGCECFFGIGLRHQAAPRFRYQLPLSEVLMQAATLEKKHGGSASGFLGHGVLHFNPEYGLPDKSPVEHHQELESRLGALLEALP